MVHLHRKTAAAFLASLLLAALGHDDAAFAQTTATPDTWETGSLTPNQLLVEHTTEMTRLCAPRNVDVIAGRPIPTNSWWGNLITCDPTSNATQPIWPNPYAISIDTTGTNGNGFFGFGIGYPFRMRFFGDTQPNGASRYYAHAVLKEVLFSAQEFATTVPTFRVADWSDLGVTAQMKLPSSTTQTPIMMETNVVSGMPYFTTSYQGLTPRIVFDNPIDTINGLKVATGATFSGERFVFVTVNGNKWILYAATTSTTATASFTFRLESNMLLRGSTGYTGILRLVNTLSDTHTGAYDLFKDCMVTGGTVNLATDSSYAFQWDTEGDCTSGLLHYALPHQQASIDGTSAARVANVVMNSPTRGEMTAYVTRTNPPTWKFSEPGSIPITYYPETRLTTLDLLGGSSFLQTLIDDVLAQWTISLRGSFYFNGKAAQKYASLCLMANDRVIVGNDVSILRACITKLETAIAPFLDNSWFYKMKYDKVFGGIVSSEGFRTGDMNADFGNTVYNDHHYHYGYWVYTAAVLNFLHPSWSRINDLNAMTRLLLRDVANPNSVDPFFPKFRHFDWYRGHSYSHGVTTFADGKDEESTSEDVNFAYALFLYGQATKHARMATIGKLMTKLNARAIQTYFLMESTNQVHPASIRPNKVPGIFFDNKVDYATWFSGEKYCIHGIQMIPITPVTEFVRTKTFVQEEWDQVLAKEAIVTNEDVTNPWLSLLYANYARIDKLKAIQVLQTCQVDDGLTRSWALYMAAQLN